MKKNIKIRTSTYHKFTTMEGMGWGGNSAVKRAVAFKAECQGKKCWGKLQELSLVRQRNVYDLGTVQKLCHRLSCWDAEGNCYAAIPKFGVINPLLEDQTEHNKALPVRFYLPEGTEHECIQNTQKGARRTANEWERNHFQPRDSLQVTVVL